MTAYQFAVALEALDIRSNRRASVVLGLARSTVIRYMHGDVAVPESVRRLVVMLQRHGVPEEFAS